MTKTRSAGRRRRGRAQSGDEARTVQESRAEDSSEVWRWVFSPVSRAEPKRVRWTRCPAVKQPETLMLNAEREERSQEPTAASA